MQNGKFGYIDAIGKMVILAKYDKAANFENGFAKVTELGSEIYIDKKETKCIKTITNQNPLRHFA